MKPDPRCFAREWIAAWNAHDLDDYASVQGRMAVEVMFFDDRGAVEKAVVHYA